MLIKASHIFLFSFFFDFWKESDSLTGRATIQLSFQYGFRVNIDHCDCSSTSLTHSVDPGNNRERKPSIIFIFFWHINPELAEPMWVMPIYTQMRTPTHNGKTESLFTHIHPCAPSDLRGVVSETKLSEDGKTYWCIKGHQHIFCLQTTLRFLRGHNGV